MVLAFQSGPFNMEQGNSAAFVIDFFDINGVLSIPSAPGMTVTYTNTSNATQVDTVTLTQNGSFFNGTWSSTSAALGLATWLTTSPSSVQVSTGQIRVLQRKGN